MSSAPIKEKFYTTAQTCPELSLLLPPPPPGYFSRYRRKGPEGQSETTPATVHPVRQQHWMKSSGSDIDQILRLVPWNINQTKPALLLSHQQYSMPARAAHFLIFLE